MTNCPNCGATLGCSCQLRTDSKGVTKCTNCIDAQMLQQVIVPETEIIEHIHINLDNERFTT
jgi:transcription elongation factor Elf1